jgi:biopolymer transport protein ExbB
MSVEQGFDIQEMITGGIAEAMFTTQLGLVMVIPGLLMLSLLNIQKRGWKIRQAHEINH